MSLASSILLKMSESEAWKRRLTRFSATRRVVSRFMPGEELDDALAAVRELNAKGMTATLNPVGEHVHDEAEAIAATDEYVRIVNGISAAGVAAGLSLKLSLVGFDVDEALAERNVTRIIEAAEAAGMFVRIDMESAAYVDSTLQIYRRLRGRFTDVGVVIQSYLRRSADDVDRLASQGGSVRLVKGAYQEPPDLAFPAKKDVDANFIALLERMLADDARAMGAQVAVATHDANIVETTKRLIKEQQIDSGVEFQMLYGIRRDLQESLLAEGYPVRIYVSYGKAWYPWFMRRLAERLANLFFFFRHMFR